MDLSNGATVRTPDGKLGRVIKPSTGAGSPVQFDLDGQGDVRVYTLLLEDGEVRAYSELALRDSNEEIRRSGSLK